MLYWVTLCVTTVKIKRVHPTLSVGKLDATLSVAPVGNLLK